MHKVDSSLELAAILNGDSKGVTPPAAATPPCRFSPLVFGGSNLRWAVFAHEFDALSPDVRARLVAMVASKHLMKPKAQRPEPKSP